MRIDITEKNMVWLVEHKMADTIVAEFHRKEAVIESLIRDRDEAKAELASLRAASFVTAVSSEEYEKLKADLAKSEEHNAALCERMQDLNSEVHTASCHNGNLHKENARLKAEVERLEKEVWRMKMLNDIDGDTIKGLKVALKTDPEWAKVLKAIENNARLEAENRELKAENERLRKSGDAMYPNLGPGWSHNTKEGKQS